MRPTRLTRRRFAGAVAVLLGGGGFLAGERVGDAEWLLLLWAAWAALLVALWPRLSRTTPTTARTTVQTATVVLSAFLLVAVQLLRTQVTQGRAVSERTGTDPQSGDVAGDPRLAALGTTVRRGRILDRGGTVLAESVAEGDRYRRVYPQPAAYGVVGYFSPLRYGASGLEAAFDDELSGRGGPGAFSRALDDLLGAPRQGLDLRLSLDLSLQSLAEDLLAGRRGAVVLLDATTGATLALASAPGIDPNRLATATAADVPAADAYWQTVAADPAAPLLFRPLDAALTPGSTFKVVTAAAAIDQGIADPDTVYRDAGELEIGGHIIVERNRPDESRETWTLREALGWSLNVVFAQVGVQIGADGLRRAAERRGFGVPIPYDLPVTASRIETTPGFLDDPVAVAQTAFGQGQLLTTALQMATVAAGIANGGRVMRPWLVEAMLDRRGDVVRQTRAGVWLRPVREATADAVADMMIWAATQGAAGAAAIPGAIVGAKTGTAETGEGQEPNAWFIGFAGTDAPRYAVAVTLERGGGGGTNALPIGRELLRAALGV